MIRVKSRLWVNDHLYLIIFSAPVVVISISSLMTGFLSPGTSHLEPVVHPIHPTTQASSFRLSLLCAMSLIQLFLADSLSSDYYHHHHHHHHHHRCLFRYRLSPENFGYTFLHFSKGACNAWKYNNSAGTVVIKINGLK